MSICARWRQRGDEPQAALVQVAETLEKRAQLANAIIKGVILPQFIILPIVLALVWFALARGLSPLAQLQERIRARRPDDLSPIDSRQVPEEISPLVGSLNDMLGRLSQTIEMQKRFIADAAHQMKTPLAGMRMQSELALRQLDPDEIHRSLEQLAKSSESATRLVNQLLALARAENQPQRGHRRSSRTRTERELAAGHRAGLGAGIVRPAASTWASSSREHAGGGSTAMPDDAARNALQPDRQRAALHAGRRQRDGARAPGRRRRPFWRWKTPAPASPRPSAPMYSSAFTASSAAMLPGSGLGLAIVREIAQQHGAAVEIYTNPHSGQKPRRPAACSVSPSRACRPI